MIITSWMLIIQVLPAFFLNWIISENQALIRI